MKKKYQKNHKPKNKKEKKKCEENAEPKREY